MPSLAKEFMDAERRKMRLQATLAARRNSLMTMGRPDLSTMFGGAAPYMSPEDKRLLWEQTAPAEPKTLPDVDMSQPLSFVSSPYQRRPQTRTNPDARSVNPHGDPGLWDSLLHWPGTTVLSSGQQMAGNREGLDTVLSDGSVMRTAGGQGLSDEPTYGGLRVPQPQARPLTEFQDTVLPGSFVPRPDDLPGRAAADATILQNQADILGTPGVNLNAENARRIAATVAHNNLMRPGRIADANARLLPESGFSQGAIDSLYEDRAAAQAAAPPLAQRPAQSSYGPGLTPAAAEERYGPGGMYGTQPLPGGLYDQQGITSSTSSARPVSGGSAPRSAASQGLTDSIKQIKKRAGIIRGTAALMGGDTRAADRYEAKAMASLGIYAGEYAMSQLTDADFQSKQKLFQALRKNGMPIDQVLKVIDSGVVDEAGSPVLKQIREGSDYVTYQVYPDGSMKEFSRSPIASGKADTNVNITMPGSDKAGESFGKGLGDRVSAVLGGGEDDLFEKLKKDNVQIGPLIDAVESGQVQTGKGQEFFKNFKGVLGQFLPDSKTKDLFNKKAGMEEWWKSTVDSFVGLKLAMTKGAISDKEMKLFMDMIPSLSKTEEGNLRLLRLMRSLNNIVLAQESGTLDYIKNLAERGEDIGSESTAQQTVDWYKFLDVRKQAAIKDFHRVANGYPDARDEAYITLRADKALKQQTDAQINEHLDKYYPKVSADG